MRRAILVGILVASALDAGIGLSAQAPRRPAAVSIEATSLAFGLAAESPRLAASITAPLGGSWSLELNPSLSWGGEGVASYADATLPVLVRLEGGKGALALFAAAGAYLGAARAASGPGSGGSWGFSAGCAAELGARLYVIRGVVFIEAYGGGAAGAARFRGEGTLDGYAFGGLRIGLGLGRGL